MYYISFPGLGIEPFHIDKIAFSIFGHGVAWYGILITCGMILAVLLAMKLIKHEGISSDDIIDLAFCVIIFGVIGARAYYVIFSWGEINYIASGGTFFENLFGTIYNCIAIWEGGLAIYGGVIGGLLSALIFSKIKKISYLKIVDILAPCCLVGQIIGRWGNFINVEAYGGETTLPWRMGILYMLNGETISEKYVHPTFLYESLWNLIVITVILTLYRKKKFDGQMCAIYFIGYGFGRMLIEGLRTDSLMLGNLRISQFVGFVSIILGIAMMIYLYGRAKKLHAVSAEEYVPVYDKLSDVESETESEEKKTENKIDNTEDTDDKGE